jgi:hypothetical protein
MSDFENDIGEYDPNAFEIESFREAVDSHQPLPHLSMLVCGNDLHGHRLVKNVRHLGMGACLGVGNDK